MLVEFIQATLTYYLPYVVCVGVVAAIIESRAFFVLLIAFPTIAILLTGVAVLIKSFGFYSIIPIVLTYLLAGHLEDNFKTYKNNFNSSIPDNLRSFVRKLVYWEDTK